MHRGLKPIGGIPMEKKTNNSSRSNSNTINTEILKRSMEAVPKWALALSAVILVMSFAIRQIGLDITTPINRILSAYAERVESEAKHLSDGGTYSTQITELQEKVKQLSDQLDLLTLRIEEVETGSYL